MQESREEWALLSPKIKGIGVQRWDHSLSGVVVGLQEHAEFCSHSFSQPLGMQRILSPVKPHLACLSWAGLRRCYRKNPPLLFIEAWQMGQRRRVSSGWGDAVFRSLVQVHYLLMKKRCHAVVKHSSLTPDLPMRRGQLSPYQGLNLTAVGICRKISCYKSRLLERISPRWTLRSFYSERIDTPADALPVTSDLCFREAATP